MKSSAKSPIKELSENQRTALVSLLADEDQTIYQTVRTKLLSYGDEVTEWLRPHLLSSDPLLRRRSQEIVDFFARQDADTAFLAFCLKQGEEFNVEDGVWALARTRYPNVNPAAHAALLDTFASELRSRLAPSSDPEHIVATINEFLFDELGFTGNEENYYEPENSYLNRVIDRRTGNPISLCLVYMLLGRRLKLPISGIGLPGHFICRFQSSKEEIYIDAFNRGKLLSKGDCIKYLQNTNHGLNEGHLTPVTARRILLRICANLHQIYTQLNQPEEVGRFQRYLVALAK